MKPNEIIYFLFLLTCFAAAIILITVAWIQWNKLEGRYNDGNSNIYHNHTGDSGRRIETSKLQGTYANDLHSADDWDEYPCVLEPTNYILPYLPEYEHRGLYIRQTTNHRGSWAPAYYHPWNKHPGLDQAEPAIQSASWLFA